MENLSSLMEPSSFFTKSNKSISIPINLSCDRAFKDDDVSAGTKTPKQVSYYVDSPSGEMTRDEPFDIANEVRQSFAVEERLFSLCHAEGKALSQQQNIHRRRVKIAHGHLLLMKSF